jgi:hypothetical protein
MAFAWFTEHRRRRREKHRYRAMVKKWYSDGGDNRFRFDYPLDSRSLVLDVGGYEGQWASDVYARYRCRIMVFEPVARFAHDIAERFRHNTDITVSPTGSVHLHARRRSICGVRAARRIERPRKPRPSRSLTSVKRSSSTASVACS